MIARFGYTVWTLLFYKLWNFYQRMLIMNSDQIKGNWKQLTGKIKEQWGKLTDDDLTTINGRRDQLLGKLQERYGYTKEQAEREIEAQRVKWDEAASQTAGHP
jgi:uncharacterized protein YjbJ (UPF0337 family)